MAGREIGELRRGEESVGGDMGVGVGVGAGAGVGVRMRVRRTLVGRRRSALSTQQQCSLLSSTQVRAACVSCGFWRRVVWQLGSGN